MFEEEENPIDTVEIGARVEALEDVLAKIGLHQDTWHLGLPSPEGKPTIMVNYLIGDIAFSDRVQNPQKVTDDRVVESMDSSFKKEEFDNRVAEIKKLLKDNDDV